MRTYLLPVFLLLLISCGDGSSEKSTPEGSSNMSEQTLADTCDCSTLQIDSLGNHLRNGQPFTGTCVSYYDGSETKYLEKNILNGLLHGKVEYFDKSGESLLQEFYEDGVQKRSGNQENGLTCDCSELQIQTVQNISVYKLDDVPFTGKCEKHYENSSQLYMESSYKNGLLDGYTVYYNKDGSTILMEKYERGELTSSVH